ncbi:OmpA family protein [Pseudorhodoferax sp.]|uniref:OmpA family protein n=1 Tax=Pseudorhodoferax sp. TaxID=1993553 RepID=UPI0039E31DFB
MQRRLLLASAVLAAALAACCAAPPAPPAPAAAPPTPRAYVALLPNADGSTGQVVYTGPMGRTELSRAGQAVALSGSAEPFMVSDEQLQRDAGRAIAAQPRPPRTFLLYFGTAEITPTSQALLPQILAEVRSRPTAELSIVGHTDTVGPAEQNAVLSLRRAEQAALLLQDAIASAQQVEITSHGENDLLIPTPDETAEPRNRRVEVTVR